MPLLHPIPPARVRTLRCLSAPHVLLLKHRLPATQVTNRRVNALENVTIPRMEGVISYINRELDELER